MNKPFKSSKPNGQGHKPRLVPSEALTTWGIRLPLSLKRYLDELPTELVRGHLLMLKMTAEPEKNKAKPVSLSDLNKGYSSF